jgi:type I restriction enzyme S subunit
LVVTGEERKSNNEYQFDCEAVIVPLVSGTGHGHASIKRIHFQKGKFALGSILCAITPKDKTQLNAEYLYRFLNLNKENELVARMKGMANVTLPIKEIAQIEIPLPPLKEQIVFIERYKNLECESNLLSNELAHQLSLVKKLRQQILQDAVQGKLVPQIATDEPASELLKKIKAEKAKLIAEKKIKKEKDLPPIKPEEIPFEIPENWVWCRLGEITDIQRGSSPRPKGDSRYFSKIKTDFNWITISDISDYCKDSVLLETREHLTEDGSKHSRYVDVDEFIIAVSGSTTGKCCITGINGFIYDGLATAKIIRKGLNSRFLLNYMMSLYSKINNSKSGASFPNINTEFLYNLLLPLPSQAEQNRIVQKLNELMQYCNELEASIKESQEQNEKLLQQVLRESLRKN